VVESPQKHPVEPPPVPIKRRSLLKWLWGVVAAITAAAVVLAPLVAFVFRSRRWPTQWVPLGPATDFPHGETRMVTFDNPIREPWDGIVAHSGVFVRNESHDEKTFDRFLVLAVNCAHLGCPVTWFPASGLFMCPCHGGVYYADGSRASGPPPRGLYRCPWRVRAGLLEVQAPHYPTLQDTEEDQA
jgi:menaquinol-cytochrome c reductase iron-sulfur subunit